MNIGQNIAHYRKLSGQTQEQLAEKLGVTGQSVSKWENGLSNPDISVLPDLAKTLGMDINALFTEIPAEPEQIKFTELPQRCYDALIPLYLKAQREFYGAKGVETEEHLQKRIEKTKESFEDPAWPKCAFMMDEGHKEHGSVLLSSEISLVDCSYGGPESVPLFDLDKAGEVLSVLGNRNARQVLKVLYESRITHGEGATSFTPTKLAEITGLSADAVREAAVQLRHVRLLDEIETMGGDGCKKEYCPLYTKDFLFPVAILRLAHIFASDMTYTTLLYRGADYTQHYEGPGI